MEFWGVEVKAGKPLKVTPGRGTLIHISQVSLGESKKKPDERIHVYVEADKQKFVLGTLSREKFPQMFLDLLLHHKEFELSHNWKNGSVYFSGYMAPDLTEGDVDTDSSEEEEIPLTTPENGKPKPAAKPAAKDNAVTLKTEASEKLEAKAAETSKDKLSEDGSKDHNESEDKSDSEDEEVSEDEEDSDEMSEDDSSDEDEETLKKAESGKKRPNEAATTPVPGKKAKFATPVKTDGKKGAHTATPHPSKQAGKSKAKSQQSGGQFSCNSCSKTFNSENALQSHNKAKHK